MPSSEDRLSAGRRNGKASRMRGHSADRVIVDEVPGVDAARNSGLRMRWHDPADDRVAGPPPDGCPVHDLPPDQPVLLRVDGVGMRTTAEMFCQQWHDTAPLRETVSRVRAAAEAQWRQGQQGHTVLPPAFRRPPETTANTCYPRLREEDPRR